MNTKNKKKADVSWDDIIARMSKNPKIDYTALVNRVNAIGRKDVK